MARELGDATLGLASEAGVPSIDGVDPTVLALPALEASEALTLIPNSAGSDPIRNWILALDVYIPQPSGTFASLLQTGSGDGDVFLRDNGDGTAGIGVSGVYDGAAPFDAWTRIVLSVTEEGGSTILRKFIDGVLVGTQDLGATDRFDIDPTVGLKLFTDNDGETTPLAVSSVFFTTAPPTPAEVAGLVATFPTADAAGFLPSSPDGVAFEINFENEDLAPRYGSADVVLEGFGFRTAVAVNDSAFGFASQFGVDGPGGVDVGVLDYAAYTPEEGVIVYTPAVDGDLSSYTAVWDVYFDALPGFQSLLQTDVSQSGDGDLFVRSDGGIGVNGDYDGSITPGSWRRVAITVEDQGGGSATLSKYLDGVFLDSQTVNADRFTLKADTGFLLLSDNDGETSTGYLAHFGLSEEVLDATAIAALGGADAAGPFTEETSSAEPLPASGGDRTLRLTFDSSFRPYDAMTGEVLVSIDGGAFQSLLTLDASTVPGGSSSLSRANETVELDFAVPEAADDVAFRFTLRDGGNDWWWAVDNIALTEGDQTIFAENFNGLVSDLGPAVDENIPADTLGWTDTPPAGWTRENDPNMPQGAAEWQGWSFATQDFWLAADGQNRSDFTKAAGVFAIADPDEWDDFNDGSQTGDDFDSSLTSPSISLELPATATTYQVGFDDYKETVDFGFVAVKALDDAEELESRDRIQDLLLAEGGETTTIDLAAAFGEGATGFTVTNANGDVVGATINGATLELAPGALGHSDLVIGATVDGQTVTENFRAIVAGENAYIFAVIPDTQDYTSNPAISETFGAMTDWLVSQKDALAIQHAIHVGDIVQFGAVSQWLIAEDAMERLDGELSYTLAVGNHDQQRPGFASAFSFETDVDSYFTPEQVGATAAQGGGTYDGFDVGADTFGNGDTYADSIRNHYTTLETPDGAKWLIFSLEFGMPDDVLRWASEVIEQHLDHRVIIDTHSWNGGDGRVTPTTEPLNTDNGGWGYAIRDNPRNVNDGEDAWRELASKYPNIAFTFNGHNFMGGAETVVSYGAGGEPTHQIFVNYQNGAWRGVEGVGTNGGNGAMRLIVVDPDNERVSTHTKIVELDSYFNDFPDHEEVFEGVDLGGAPKTIAIAKAGGTEIASGDGVEATVVLDPSATIGQIAGATYAWFDARGEKLGETDGAPLTVALPTGLNHLTLKVTDADGDVSTDKKVVIVEAPAALLTDTFDDGDLVGWTSPEAGVGAIFETGTDVGFALPSIGGVGQIPLTLNFDSSFRPYDDMTGEVLVSFDEGATFTSLLTIDTASTPGGSSALTRANESVSLQALAPNSASSVQFAWRLFDTDNDWWWAIDNVSVDAPQTVRDTLLAEDFEGLPLGPFVSPGESGGDGADFTTTPPTGWSRDLTTTPIGDPVEFQGWTFLDKDSWIATAGDQARSSFTLGDGTVAVADGDEYDDGTNIEPNLFNVFLVTPEIDLTGYDASSVRLEFDSSFRPYDAMTGTVEVSFDDGATFTTLLTLDASTAGGNSSLTRANEAVSIDIDAGAADGMILRWGLTDTDNDWWWAVDNIAVSAERDVATSLLSENFDSLPLGPAVDETFDPTVDVWTPTPPAGWEQIVAPTTSQGTTEWQGWTFADKNFWVSVAGDQARSSFGLGQNTLAIADGDEWDDNGGAAGDTNEFDSTLRTPQLDLTAVGGGQPAGDAAGVIRVPGLTPEQGLLVTPGASGEITDYTVIFDILASETSASFSGLFQTNVANDDDADIYLRNDGDAYSIGISGDYDGAVAYGEWARIALTFETDGDGVQTLTKYLDGALLDTQIVDADVSDGSRWTIDADAGFLLFAEPNNFTSEIYANAFHFAPTGLDAATIAGLGGGDVDGPVAAPSDPNAFQLNFNGGLDGLDYGSATAEAIRLGEAETSLLVKGSIFGNPDGEGEAALYAQSNGARELLLWEGGAAWSDYVFDVAFEPADNDTVGVVFYYVDENNFYELTMDQQNDVRTLRKVQDGVETVLATEAGSYRHFADQKLSVAVIGGEIVATLDETLLFGGPVADAAPLAGGTVGVLASFMDRVEFDNVSVNPIDLSARLLGATPSEFWGADVDGDGVETVNLTAAASTSAAGVASYDWLVGGSVVATGETAALDLAAGAHEVTLRVTDLDGAVAEDTRTVEIAPESGVLAADDFEDGDFNGWTIVDEGTDGAPSDWAVESGAFVQKSDISSSQQGTGSNAFSVEGDGPFILRDGAYALWDDPAALAWTDYAVEATLTPGDNDGIGLLLRYQDADNYYKLESDAETGLVMLTRHLDGRESILARGYDGYTAGETQHWRIEADGGKLTAWIDGMEVFGTDVEDRTLETGTVGLYAWSSENLAFDDVVVTDLADPLEGANIVEATPGRDRLVGATGEVDAFIFEVEDASYFSRDQIREFEMGDLIDLRDFGFSSVVQGASFPIEDGVLQITDYNGFFTGLRGETASGEITVRIYGDAQDVFDGVLI